MRPRVGFAQILEEKLACEGGRERGATGPSQPPWPQAAPAFLFAADSSVRGGRVVAASAFYSRLPGAIRSEPSRPTVRWSPAQRAALECLRGFGAPCVDDRSTGEELRAAFRTLALRFHPDRHPDVDEAEREYLAKAFGRITAAYRILVPRTVN